MPDRLDPTTDDDGLADAVARLGRPTDLVDPPADLWDRITAAAGETAPVAAGVPADAMPGGEHDAELRFDTLVPLVSTGRLRSRRVVFAAAAAVLAVALIGSLAVSRIGRGDDRPDLVADADLSALVDDVAAAHSTLERVGDTYRIEVDAELAPHEGSFYELWLIDTDVTQPVSLGRYVGPGAYDVPADLSPESFPIVDISIELDDGDASHSGDSVLRGVLNL